MALHLIKMAAGIESLEQLDERQDFLRRQAELRSGRAELLHVTRFFPKRADEILTTTEGVPGSLYWVFQKTVQARQEIANFREVQDAEGGSRCAIVLEGPLIRVEWQHRKAFQGWRYLKGEDAPLDIGAFDPGTDVPVEMRAALKELCLI